MHYVPPYKNCGIYSSPKSPIFNVMTDIHALLTPPKTIAMIGASNNPDRPSFAIMQMLMHEGFTIIPINPNEDMILGQKSYPSITALPDELKKKIDIVNVFRRPAATPEVARQTADAGIPVLWLQQGIINQEAEQIAKDANITYFQDRCIAVEYRLHKTNNA